MKETRAKVNTRGIDTPNLIQEEIKYNKKNNHINEYNEVLGNLKEEKIKTEKIENVILSNTRKISEDFEKAYKIEKKHSKKNFLSVSNENKVDVIVEKNLENANNDVNCDSIADENADLGKLSIYTTSEKPSIIDFVFEAPEANTDQKFSVHNINDVFKKIYQSEQNYVNPFAIEEKKLTEVKSAVDINTNYSSSQDKEKTNKFFSDSNIKKSHAKENEERLNNKTFIISDSDKKLDEIDTNHEFTDSNVKYNCPGEDALRNTNNSKFSSTRSSSVHSLPKRKKAKRIFEEFLTIGIENTGLEYIDDLNEMDLTPKITYNYPNKLNIKFLKNFCFNEGVKVRRHLVESDLAYDSCILEHNFFNKPKTSFCLVQQVSPDDVLKYFIMGIKFDDFYITPPKTKGLIDKNRNIVNIFIYEKTYLFISLDPVCNLIEKIFGVLLGVKKMNFLFNMTDFASVFIKENYMNFIEENNEKTSKQITEVLHYFNRLEFPKFQKEISFESKFNNITMKYTHPSQYEKQYLAIDFLAKRFMKYFSASLLFKIILSVLLETSFIFISDDIEILTSTVYLVGPFKWPFILIPNLPLDLISMIESPVPFLIGILGDEKSYEETLKRENIEADIIFINSKGIKYKENKENPNYLEDSNLPDICDLLPFLDTSMKNLLSTISTDNSEDINAHHECVYRQIFKLIKSEIADKIYEVSKIHSKLFLSLVKFMQPNYKFNLLQKINSGFLDSNNNIQKNQDDYNKILSDIRKYFVERLEQRDRFFGELFSKTQIFINYISDVIM